MPRGFSTYRRPTKYQGRYYGQVQVARVQEEIGIQDALSGGMQEKYSGGNRYELIDAEMSLEEISKELGVTKERVRQIQEGALNKLRKKFGIDPESIETKWLVSSQQDKKVSKKRKKTPAKKKT